MYNLHPLQVCEEHVQIRAKSKDIGRLRLRDCSEVQ